MDALATLSGDDDGSEEEEEAQQEAEDSQAAKKRLKSNDPTPEDLEKFGLKSGPSVLYVPEPKAGPGEVNWDWYSFCTSNRTYKASLLLRSPQHSFIAERHNLNALQLWRALQGKGDRT